ncbi:helix-turn-helix domain-containing protein [Saccharopolyspora rosea]|uniref:Helix-turn-helix domain-containing protein n=1 Tax=Saccharopolyspora rosea TaxID=524884 RepID=A0ABW3FRT5_9PSEU|nr:helix-turn-helix transcriptional regulator [Saccharopolyspora rosea]
MTTARSRGIGAEVRRLRKDAGLRLEELSELCGWSRATFGRIESGDKIPTNTEMAIILGTLGVKGGERKWLLEMTNDAHQTHWWEIGHPGLPAQLISLLESERHATRITDVTLGYVPGLLQTAEYARAVIRNGGLAEEVVDSRVSVRLGRQSILTRSKPVELHALMDEAVLHRPIGGREVMAEQLRHLLRMGERPNVTIQVVPFSVGEHPGLSSNFLLLEFERQRPIVHLEHRRSGIFIEEPRDTSLYQEAASNVVDMALSPADSAELIAARAREMEGRDENRR